MTYYDDPNNVASHPFVIAYKSLDNQKTESQTQMNILRGSHNNYVMHEERMKRLHEEQKELLKIMSNDLTSDFLIDKLKGTM